MIAARAKHRTRRGIILAVVLVMIGLLSLAMAGFVFFVRAETAGILALTDMQQARLATESGFEEIVSILRVSRDDVSAWYDVPDRFRHALIWSEDFDRESDPVAQSGSRRDYIEDDDLPPPAWRYTAVAPRFDGPEGTMRFGITPESAKLHLNLASESQITKLLTPLLLDLQLENPQELIDALLDWRDADDDLRENGAETEYYNGLEPAYNPKNGPFDTVEELLLVKGFTAAVLYGEDTNRNGILDENEDDSDDSFPFYDNGDGTLNLGIAPFLTVFSREPDSALDNKPRINLNQNVALITAQIAEAFPEEELDAEVISFLVGLKSQNFDFGQLQSAADLYPGSEGDGDDPNGAAPQTPAELANSPITLEHMPQIMDRFSVRSLQQAQAPIFGRININAAPARVLGLIPGITTDAIAAIIETRRRLDPETLSTSAWPLTSEAISAAMFKRIAPQITTQAFQFHIEVLGYADHVKLSKRVEWIIEMAGPLPQVKYRRDLTRLGIAWPIDSDTVIVTDG